MYYYHPHTGRFEKSSRSSVRATTVGPSSRRGYDDDLLYFPKKTSVLSRYDTTGTEYSTSSDINRNLIMSSAAMEDNYDITSRSRLRDRDVLAAANRAIVDTEIHSSPRSAVAARRVMRGRSMPPAPLQTTKTEVPVAYARASYNTLRYSVPPASARNPRARYHPRVTVRPRYRNYVPVRTTPSTRGLMSSELIEGQRRVPLSLLAYLRNLEMALKTKSYRSHVASYVPVRLASRKAALLASKVDTMMPPRRRAARSGYAQAKLRQMRKDKRDSGEPEPAVSVVADTTTTTLRASPPAYLPARSKPIYDLDGLKKPNIMSWQYRLDTYVSPDDLIIVPRSLGSVKQQLLEVQNKLDRHKQLMDRYLVTEKGLTAEEQQALSYSKAYLESRA